MRRVKYLPYGICPRPISALVRLRRCLTLRARLPGFNFVFGLGGVLLSCRLLFAAETIDFSRDIRPLLSDRCYKCHGPDENERKAGLRLDLYDAALAELESGNRAIVPGNVAESTLVARLMSTDPDEQMPPPASGKKLSANERELLKKWVEQGAAWRGHWSFMSLQPITPPGANTSNFVHNPIDQFVLARLQSVGMQPSPPTDKQTLIRRVTLDLTGLPPTPTEVDAFVNDNSADAYEALVDRLLASPRYGEHMARYWLDAVRYADTHGLQYDNERSIWKYRDWVIDAFNRNQPFNQFTVEQLAGDLLSSPTLEQRVASGFNRCNVSTGEGGSIEEEVLARYAVDRVEAMSTVWLGLTTGCAVCHDHKFDPITQKEFFQLFAFYNSAADAALNGNLDSPPPMVKVPTPEQDSQQKQLTQQLADVKQKLAAELANVEYQEPTSTAETVATSAQQNQHRESLLAWEAKERLDAKSTLPVPVLAAIKVEAAARNDAQQKLIRDYFLEHVYSKTRSVFDPLHQQIATLTKQLADLEAAIPSSMVMADMPQPRDTFVLIRGEYDNKGDKVAPGVPASLPPLPAGAPANRLGLAQWLVDPSHPLTARVAVNRFWQQYFGTGIVETSDDFGAQGSWPTHPELLDWLAGEFIRSGWDVKHLQRLIVTSSTYRQSSKAAAAIVKGDPQNELLARGPRFRLDAEVIRDSALASAGLLVEHLGGRSVKPYQPEGLWEAVGIVESNTAVFKQDTGDSLYRRSLYTFWKRSSPPPSLLTFDAPSRETCTVRRPRTNTPLQALVLMNDQQYVEAARKMAERLMARGTPIEEQLEYALRIATARSPTADELAILLKIYNGQLADFQADKDAATKLVSIGESNRNIALDVGQLAAMTMMANLILNLDEAVTKE